MITERERIKILISQFRKEWEDDIEYPVSKRDLWDMIDLFGIYYSRLEEEFDLLHTIWDFSSTQDDGILSVEWIGGDGQQYNDRIPMDGILGSEQSYVVSEEGRKFSLNPMVIRNIYESFVENLE